MFTKKNGKDKEKEMNSDIFQLDIICKTSHSLHKHI